MARTRRRHRITAIVFVTLAAAVCLGLGYWQWDRFESASGTGQNLGYALQWPLFAAFCVYGYRRFVKLEDDQADDPATPAAQSEPGVVDRLLRRDAAPAVTEIPADLLPGRSQAASAAAAPAEDSRLAEYNDYLARLDEHSTKGRG